ncbi:MAG: proline racemase family protein [Armatimonadetes bacterium]|nr:proline racemase family protein [Armatimonadota bacterium]
MQSVEYIDSHTGGEPTRVIVSCIPVLVGNTIAEKAADFAQNHSDLRRALVCEPRGSEVLVGALLLETHDPTCDVGVIFFNNVGVLGMCGHGTIGLAETVEHLGRISTAKFRMDTPVGSVEVRRSAKGQVSLENIASRRKSTGVRVTLLDGTVVTGDIAYGGNWFFLVSDHGRNLCMERVQELTEYTMEIRNTLAAQGITGDGNAEIDHVELFAPSENADSKNFVLCPGRAYDRSPCGTGTSAKLACLYADGKIQPGQIWRQESITGSIFEGCVSVIGGEVIPTIRGQAFVTGQGTLFLDSDDPFCWGIPT